MAFLVIVPGVADDSVAQPQLPHAFYGTVEVANSPAGQGLVVEAVGAGVRSNIAGNPVTTLSDGTYGSVNFSSQKLMVQGNIETGAPLEFYVGGILAEVYDVVKGGSWATSYPYSPGELTELNLRIASQPAAGQTREPTPVQTVASSAEGTASTVSSGPVSGGPLLPQLPESQGQLPASEGSPQAPAGSGQPGTTGQGENPGAGSPESGSQGSTGGTETLTGSGSMTLLIAIGIVLLLVVAGGAYYYTSQKKGESGKTEEPEKKEE